MAGKPLLICASADLVDGGPGVRFVLGEGAGAPPGFAVRQGGRVFAYLNSCPHVGTELDWNPGEFFDMSGAYLVCSTHGALFEPASGLCVAGPCRGASLERIEALETAQGVFVMASPACR